MADAQLRIAALAMRIVERQRTVDVNPHRFVSLLESDDEKSFEQTQSRFAFSTSFAEESDINVGRA
jgi:hypothetical protein